MYTWLLDSGHGGLINGEYQTAGKRSPVWSDGSQLFEGEFNRAIVARLMEMMTAAGIPYVNIVPEDTDVSLGERVRRANKWNPRTSIYVSIHSNSMGAEHAGKGRGFEIFTSVGQTRSDHVADVFYEAFKSTFPTARMRSDRIDGDVDKEANFYVLKNTNMPAVLTENFFYDNEHECRKYLLSGHGRDMVARAHFAAIEKINREGI
jgi:N-acetylmuramoyl-L-alanine amidase